MPPFSTKRHYTRIRFPFRLGLLMMLHSCFMTKTQHCTRKLCIRVMPYLSSRFARRQTGHDLPAGIKINSCCTRLKESHAQTASAQEVDAAQVLKIGLIVGGQWQRVRPRVSRMGYRAFDYFKRTDAERPCLHFQRKDIILEFVSHSDWDY